METTHPEASHPAPCREIERLLLAVISSTPASFASMTRLDEVSTRRDRRVNEPFVVVGKFCGEWRQSASIGEGRKSGVRESAPASVKVHLQLFGSACTIFRTFRLERCSQS